MQSGRRRSKRSGEVSEEEVSKVTVLAVSAFAHRQSISCADEDAVNEEEREREKAF